MMKTSSRREFFSAGAAAVGGIIGGAALRASLSFDEVETDSSGVMRPQKAADRQVIPSACWQCVTRCPILGTVESGRLMKIDGNPASLITRGRICAKGQAGINQADNPDRLLTPLVRMGGRGEGKWKPISWQQALDLLVEGGEIAGRRVPGLRALRDMGKPEGFLFHYGRCVGSDYEILMKHFLPAYGTGSVGNHDAICQITGHIANALTGSGTPFSDFSKAGIIFSFGSSNLEASTSYIPSAQRIVEARARGVRSVTFDPRLSNTAAKSSEWIPIKPATDLAVILAMCQVIVKEGLHDGTFISAHTNVTVAQLETHLAGYTPEWAERLSDVPAGKIRSLAIEYATKKPGICLSARGAYMHHNGVQTQRAILLLQALTGNIDPSGWRPGRVEWKSPFTPPPPAKQALPIFTGEPGSYSHPLGGVSHQILHMIDKGPARPEIYMVYCHNPVYSNGDCKANAAVLSDPDKIPFLVSVDVGMSETTVLADLVLPDTVYLERWTYDGNVSHEGVPEYQIRQPICPPRGECRHFADVACELAGRLGINLGFHSAEEYVRAACEATSIIRDIGGFEYMKTHGVWCDLREPKARTPKERMKLHSEALEKAGFAALPSWMPTPGHQTMADDQLLLITYKVPVQTQSRTQNCKWLSELYHENQAWMNPRTAAKYGLSDGERAIVRSSIGEIILPIRITEGVHPGTIAISHHCGHWSQSEYASGHPAPFHRKDADGPLRWWSEHGAHVNVIIPNRGDPIAGGMCWNDTVVKVLKLQ